MKAPRFVPSARWPILAVLALAASCAVPPVKPPPVEPPPVAPPPVAPPPDISDCRFCHAGNVDYPLAEDVYRYWETSGHGQYLDRPDHRPDCAACHDMGGPAAAGHLDGKKNAPSTNTYHLVKSYLVDAAVREWDFQVTFDGYCWTACHQPAGVKDMRHERDGDPAPGAVQMGQHSSYEKALGGYPMDNDLADLGAGLSGPPHFATCVSCHDPHGTGATSRTGPSNKMSRENYKKPSQLCSRCHV